MDRWTTKRIRYLKRRFGLNPRVIIDVGVANGTPALYESFPNKFYLLVEPLDVYSEAIEGILDDHRGVWVRKAAASERGEVPFQHDLKKPALSSFHDKTALEGSSGDLRTELVDCDTPDNMTTELGLEGPFAIKIDTEGHELDVILGATKTLAETEFVVAEVSMAKRFEGGYSFADFIAAMADNDFHVVDVLKVAPARDSGPPPKFVDLFFAREPWNEDLVFPKGGR